MEKRNTLNQRFITLRQVFHDFQTSVRFSTSNSPTETFANQLKPYEFLGQLEEHFIAEKVQYLYEFVHSIFSLIFTMIREGPNQRSQKIDGIKKLITTDIGVQTDESHFQYKIKMPVEGPNHLYARQKKRAGLQIQVFEKDLTQMSQRERRRALKKMRDMIYAQEDQSTQQSSAIKDFKPNIDKISYSKSDQSIKSAIDTFKESDISTHIFLKHFMEEFVQTKDIKSSSELLNKELINSMSKAITKYKEVKYRGKGKFRLFSHTIEEIIYPTINQDACQINIKLSEEDKRDEMFLNEGNNQENQGEVDLMNQVTNLLVSKTNSNQLSIKDKIKRSRFPSLMARNGDQLKPISQNRSQEAMRLSTSSISSKAGNKKLNRKNYKISSGQEQFRNSLEHPSLHKEHPSLHKDKNSNKITFPLQKNATGALTESKKSFRQQNKREQSSILEQVKHKESIGIKSKNLKKRNISNFVGRHEDRAHLNQDKVR